MAIADAASSRETTSRDIAALQGRLQRSGRAGIVTQGHDGFPSYYDIRLNLKHRPLVSIIIPTAGKTIRLGRREVDLITNCVSQISDHSSYKNLEIIVIDNGDLSPDQVSVLKQYGCKLKSYSGDINIPRKLNLGAANAAGEILLLMNDDIEIVNPSWIERMLEHFEKPHVGVVGAKLLYPSRQIQHAGVVHNFANPDHVRRHYPADDLGYFFSTSCARNYMAVTGACMMTRSDIFRQVGGYWEDLAVSYNDVDYCMKVRQLGFSCVYAPKAELIHMESQSREAFLDSSESHRYYEKWPQESVSDFFYNERMLAVVPPSFEPSVNPRVL
ncbi:MAG: glycosyltransferase [Hyphomicrobium sp.]